MIITMTRTINDGIGNLKMMMMVLVVSGYADGYDDGGDDGH